MWKPLGYLNHPPYWIHPADQHTSDECRMLVKINKPVDFVFKPIPETWSGYEYIDTVAEVVPPGRGISNLFTDDLPWEPVLHADGLPTGYDGKRLYDDPNTGWITWLMRVPAGWRGIGNPKVVGGGDELFVVEGDLTVWREEPVGLTSDWYYCDPDTTYDGGNENFSTAGCVAIRWSFEPTHLRISPLRY